MSRLTAEYLFLGFYGHTTYIELNSQGECKWESIFVVHCHQKLWAFTELLRYGNTTW